MSVRINRAKGGLTLACAQANAGPQELLRINSLAVDAGFVVQMRTGRTSRRTDEPDHLADLHDLADLDIDLGEMAVAGRKSVAVINLDHAAVTAGPAGRDHLAVGGD